MANLVVYYSRAGENYFGGTYRFVEIGNTEKAARMIAEITGGDLFKLEQTVPYSDDYRTCIMEAKEDMQRNARPKLKALPEDLDKYDEIYLGFPIYWDDMPMAVYTFLESYGWSGKTIHPFCTHEGSGLADAETGLREECPDAVITEGLAIHGSYVDRSKADIEKWIASVSR